MNLQKLKEERKSEISREALVAVMVTELRTGKALDQDNAEQEVFELTKMMDVGLEEAASFYHEIEKEAIEIVLQERKERLEKLGNPNAELEGAITPKEEEE